MTRLLLAVIAIVLAAAVAAALALFRPHPEASGPPTPVVQTVAPPDPAARTVTLTAHDDMTFSTTTIAAKPGEALTIVMRTISRQPLANIHHNYVLLEPDTSPDAFVRTAVASHAHGQHIPPALERQVIASTNVASADETVSVTFRAPTTPGRYVYLCTVPGHFAAGMKGALVVN